MTRKILASLIILVGIISLAFQPQGQFARRVLPIFNDPATPCVEGSIYYHMLQHKFLICKNTGIEEVGTGVGGGSGGEIPIANAVTTGKLLNTDWILFNNKQNALGFIPENTANKGATNGYADLVGGKIPIARISEVISSIDLTDYNTSSGSGTTAIRSTISAAATGDILTWNGSNWINADPIVASVFGRTGNVIAQTGDYSASQVSNAFNLLTANAMVNVSVPSNPSAGQIAIWADSTDLILKTKNSSGNLAVTIRPATCSGTDKISSITSAGLIVCTPDQAGGGSGVLTLNTLEATNQNLTSVSDSNITLDINSAIATHTFTISWAGLLPASRMVATTVHTNQSNTFGNFIQTFQTGTNFVLVDPTITSKSVNFDLSNISAATTRIVNIPNANSTTVQASSAGANQFATSISAQGVIGYGQPSFIDLAGSATDAQITDNISIVTIPNQTTNGFVKTTTNNGTLVIDTNTYLTGNQTVILSGDVSGSGATSIVTTIANNSVTGAKIAMGSDAIGDIIYYNGTDYVRLAAGANNTILTITGGIPSWVAGGGAAPIDATFITQTPNGTLNNEQALSTLATGLLKNTTATGVLSIAVGGTDYELPLTFSAPLSRATNTISCPTCGLTTGNLGQFATTTSAQLATVLSDETGSGGGFVRATSPIFITSISTPAISNLTTNGFVKTSGSTGILIVDTNTYLTGNQTITLSGDVAGSGATSIVTTIANNVITGAKIQLGSDATGDLMYYNGTDYIRLPIGSAGQFLSVSGGIPAWSNAGTGDMTLATTQTVTGAKTFDATKLIVGSVATDPTVVIGSFYRDLDDGRLYFGVDDTVDFWGEIFIAGQSLLNLASNVTGILSVVNGGTGINSYTKGDILVATSSTTLVKLPVGINGQCLKVDSATSTGLIWGDCGTGGGSSDIVNDTFTETSTIDLASHIGEVGATWTHHPHANYSGTNINIDATIDRVFGGGTSAYYASAVPSSANYTVCGDFHHVSTIAVNIAVAGRMDTTADTMYIGRLTDGTTWQIRKIVAGTATTLGTSTNQIPTIGNFKEGCLIMTGNQISFTVNGVTEIPAVTDSAITAAGRVGVRTTGVSSASTGIHLDNLRAF